MRGPRTSRTTFGSAPAQLPRARKRFGQHFLEPAWVDKLIEALAVQPSDHFLEIGPGRGALTAPLAALAAAVVAIEIDRDLAAHLTASATRATTALRVVVGDVLDVDLAEASATLQRPVRVVGNLPYNVSAPILFKLFRESAAGALIADATVMLQREVADRLCAKPGTAEYGLLSIFGALHATVRPVLALPPGAFRPPPKVHSSVVQLRFHAPPVDVGHRDVFDALVRGAFMHRRKTLVNALRPVLDRHGRAAPVVVARAGLSPTARPGDLALADFAALARAVL